MKITTIIELNGRTYSASADYDNEYSEACLKCVADSPTNERSALISELATDWSGTIEDALYKFIES